MLAVATLINFLVGQNVLPANTFWDIFLFYLFFYILFDVVPVYNADGQPTNGRAIFDLIWHGESSDFVKPDANTESKSMQHISSYEDGLETTTNAQAETIANMNRDQRNRGDHTRPETSSEHDNSTYTDAQNKTIRNRNRDMKERDDHKSF
ncbi:hypothetical protein [Geomicrobium sp. JCM 19055]|uniref:hypothetical protein n=1 Tax=Geomicrobium sp. JCM 19055 TaxID=1460649 RepID=UPI000693A97B|nr:hypothetical protein [Geomicrobium sp. JCM 19055]